MFKFVIRRRISKDFTPELMSLTDRFITFSLLRKIALLFSRAFFILQVLFILHNDLGKLGYLWSIAFLVEGISGYPSGVLKDRIGYRKILFLAYVIFGLSYYVIALAANFNYLIVVMVLESLAFGLDSESLQSWFDKNYAVLSKTVDPERKVYSKIFARMSSTNDLVGLAGAIIGGYIASTMKDGRQLGFLIQAVMMLIMAILFGLGVKNYYEEQKEERVKHHFVKPFLQGIGFVITNPRILLISLALVIDIIIDVIWLYLLLIPIFYAYTGDEFYISLLNFAIFAVTFVYLTRQAKNWTKIDPRKWLPVVYMVQGFILFGSLYFLVRDNPGNNSVSWIGITVIFVAGSISTILLSLTKIFSYRILLDNIPNDKRNAYYSLLPTLALLIVSALNFFAGQFIEGNGFDLALLGLIGLRLVGGFFIFLSITIFGLSKVTNIKLYDENIPLIFDNSLDTLQSSFLKFKPTDWYLGETSKIVWMNLLEVARQDDNVTDEELDLLTKIMVGVKEYLDLLEKAFEDQQVTDQESEELTKLRNKVLDEARKEALRDKKITQDEEEILEKLSKILIELEKVENIGMQS